MKLHILPAVRTVWTIGHSTRSEAEFLQLLDLNHIRGLADVRRFPGSRRHPQFASDRLAQTLARRGIEYAWMPKLGGRRRPLPGSVNTAWRNESFRGYADHLASAEFSEGLDELLELASRHDTAIMCSEAVWWRCHRALISDVLLCGGVRVVHIMDATHNSEHKYSSAANVQQGHLSYRACAMPGASESSPSRDTSAVAPRRKPVPH